MPDGKIYKVIVRIIEGNKENQLPFLGVGVGLEKEGVSFIPTPQELVRMGKTVPLLAIFVLTVFHFFGK